MDRSDVMASLGQVAVWSLDLAAWGECAQAETEALALEALRRRTGADGVVVTETLRGEDQLFAADRAPATDAHVTRTLAVLREERTRTIEQLRTAGPERWDREDPDVDQPGWMPWRTPAAIARHVVDTESRGYARRLGLPELEPVDDLLEELSRSAAHVRGLLASMPRTGVHRYRDELWTPMRLLRRLAWHERVEGVFLRRRVRALV
ncbi:hypothetical protein D1781_02475 [Amnibacterium setariae]|uniref:DinB family protein n=1 Tax=Amnibacterium setariae TaxID=2306585 RepID=A0A3A1U1V3_9MICO|nr:hypothetical protein D1781_02475 [Amnibacterium setariae]